MIGHGVASDHAGFRLFVCEITQMTLSGSCFPLEAACEAGHGQIVFMDIFAANSHQARQTWDLQV